MKALFALFILSISFHSKAEILPAKVFNLGEYSVSLYEFTPEDEKKYLVPFGSERCKKRPFVNMSVGESLNIGNSEFELISIEDVCFDYDAKKVVEEVFVAPHKEPLFPDLLRGKLATKLKDEKGKIYYTSTNALDPMLKLSETNFIEGHGMCFKTFLRSERGSLKCAYRKAKKQIVSACKELSGKLDKDSFVELIEPYCGGEWSAQQCRVRLEAYCELSSN